MVATTNKLGWSVIFLLILSIADLTSTKNFEKIKSKRIANNFYFLDSLLINEFNMTVMKFPQYSNYTYVTHCGFSTLSINERQSLNCLLLALSVLSTSPKYSFIILVSSISTISEEYKQLATRLGIQLYLYNDIMIPPAGKQAHTRAHR